MDYGSQDSHYDGDNNSYRILSKGDHGGGALDKDLLSKTERGLDVTDKLGQTHLPLLNNIESPSNKQLIIRKNTNKSDNKSSFAPTGILKSDKSHQSQAAKIKSLNNSYHGPDDLREGGPEIKVDLNNVEDDEAQEVQPDYEVDQVPDNVLRVMKSKNMFEVGHAPAMDVEEGEEDVLELKLDFEEDPMTQGSLDGGVKIDAKKIERCLIRHTSKFRIRWDLFIILLVIYNSIQIPLELAFQEKFSSDTMDNIGHVVDICFVLDIIFNFRTTYVNEKTGLEVIEGKIIAKTYILQWRFWCDILSIIPFEVLYNWFAPQSDDGSQTNTTTFKILNLLKLIRLLRLGRIITYLKFRQDVKIGFRMVYLLFFLLLLVHWISCVWYILVEGSTWMPPMDANYGETTFYEVDMSKQYPIVFYYAILLLVGSEILPMNTTQTIVASLVVIMGQITTAFIFGNMAALLAAMNQKDSQFQEQFETISNLMRAIQLPVEVQEEVESYLLHIQQIPDMQQDMRVFLKMLSPTLRSQILFHIYKTIISKISLFDQCSNIELRYIVNKMKTIIFLPDDEIIRQGDNGNKLYFISRGVVDVWIGPDEAQDNIFESIQKKKSKESDKEGFDKDSTMGVSIDSKREASDNPNKLVKSMTEGDYFGEISLITHLKRTTTIKAKDFTTLAYMIKRHFISSREEFPQIFQNFKKAIKDKYDDENFRFRKKMIRNVPYFRNLSELIIQELVYLLRPVRYDPGMLVVKRGDSTDKIFFLKAGIIDVEVPLRQDKMHFDTLNTGSCFCIFSAFHEDKKQKFDFRTRTLCIVETISADDIIKLQREQLELSDELKTLRCQIDMNEKSEFDFFRYVPTGKDAKYTEEMRSAIRKKFRMAVSRFFSKLKASRMIMKFLGVSNDPKVNNNNDEARNAIFDQILNKGDGGEIENSDSEVEDERGKHFKALHALDILEKERKDKEMKLKYLKDKVSNPSLFALQALVKEQKATLTQKENVLEQVPQAEESQNQAQKLEEEDNEGKQSDLATIRKDFMGDQSMVSITKSGHPIIEGIRKEAHRVKADSARNSPDPKEDIGPEADQTQLIIKEGDITSFQFTSINDKIKEAAKIPTKDLIRSEDIRIDIKSSPSRQIVLDQSSSQQMKQSIKLSQSGSGVMSKKNLHFGEGTKNSQSFHQPRPHQESLLNVSQKDKKKSFQQVISLNNSISKSRKGEEDDDSLDLITVLKNINQSIKSQHETVSSLQKDMQQRLIKLEGKLNKIMKYENNDVSGADQSASGAQKSKLHNRSSVILHQVEESDVHIDTLGIEKDLKGKNKRLQSKPNLIHSYNQKTGKTKFLGIGNNMDVQYDSENAGNLLSFPSSPETVSKINMDHMKKEIQHQPVGTSKNHTPYFMTEYQETIVNNNFGPNKIEYLNTDRQTEEVDNIVNGPQFLNNFSKINSEKVRQQINLNPSSMNIRIQNTSGEEIEINEADANEMVYNDNTVLFEEQLDQSIERYNQMQNRQQLHPDMITVGPNNNRINNNNKKRASQQQSQHSNNSFTQNQMTGGLTQVNFNQEQILQIAILSNNNEGPQQILLNQRVQWKQTTIQEPDQQQQQQQQQQQPNQQQQQKQRPPNRGNTK